MKTKLVTAYWMDAGGYPYQGALPNRKVRYLGSLISHCLGSKLPVICYTHKKSLDELVNLKNEHNLDNLEIKILELNEVKYHKEISEIREKNFYTETTNFGLDGRGPEIMWGKFDVIERELDGFDNVYWVDVGLQHPGIFPWMYSKVYNPSENGNGIPENWWAHLDVFNFSKIIDEEIYIKLNQICKNKIMFVCSYGPQIGYPFIQKGILSKPFESPYPVGGMIGGNTQVLKKYINIFWDYAKLIIENETLCTEEVLMKPAYDFLSEYEKVTFIFNLFASVEHDDFHYKLWDSKKNPLKPFYMMWHDIKNINL